MFIYCYTEVQNKLAVDFTQLKNQKCHAFYFNILILLVGTP